MGIPGLKEDFRKLYGDNLNHQLKFLFFRCIHLYRILPGVKNICYENVLVFNCVDNFKPSNNNIPINRGSPLFRKGSIGPSSGCFASWRIA